ncbi:hypothetical protein T4E_7753 [Trichinella pseudospiralis]|uniref:Uncharacterized protein n=1 Tax=Trichinella pseudospiralis TaxID=6337 RepID=A0A0V0YEM9_TRIPS|nr:hypothetical protein T4E_7753 [Trichinella pseudospiralis]
MDRQAATQVLAKSPIRRERKCFVKRFIGLDITTHTNRITHDTAMHMHKHQSQLLRCNYCFFANTGFIHRAEDNLGGSRCSADPNKAGG